MAATKKEADGEHPATHYLVVEDPEQPSTWHLRVKDAGGNLDHGLMRAAWAALHEGYRGKKYEGPNKEEAIRKVKALYKEENLDLPGGVQMVDHLPSVLLDEFPPLDAAGLVEFPVAVVGNWKGAAREFSITSQDLASMAANFAKRKNREINVDYDHASEMPEVGRGGPVPSAGRILGLRVDGRHSAVDSKSLGVLLAKLEFTARALELIRNKEYRYVSPAIDYGARDKLTGESQGTTLTSLALTNRPFLEELPAIRLSEIDRETPKGNSAPTGRRMETLTARENKDGVEILKGIEWPKNLSGGTEVVNAARASRIHALQRESAKAGRKLGYMEARAIALSEEAAAGIDGDGHMVATKKEADNEHPASRYLVVNAVRASRIHALQRESAKAGRKLGYMEARTIALSEEAAAGIDGDGHAV